MSPLLKACRGKSEDVVEILLDNRANCDHVDNVHGICYEDHMFNHLLVFEIRFALDLSGLQRQRYQDRQNAYSKWDGYKHIQSCKIYV